MPLLLVVMGPMLGLPLHRWLDPAVTRWAELLLATPVVLWAGWPLLVRGARSVVSGHLNMFTLIALGVSVAYLYSVVATLAHRLDSLADFNPIRRELHQLALESGG